MRSHQSIGFGHLFGCILGAFWLSPDTLRENWLTAGRADPCVRAGPYMQQRRGFRNDQSGVHSYMARLPRPRVLSRGPHPESALVLPMDVLGAG